MANDSSGDQYHDTDFKFFGLNFSKMRHRIFGHNSENVACDKLTTEQLQEYASYTKLRVTTKSHLVFQQLYALLLKRFHRVKRNVKGFIAEIVVPVLYVCLALLVATLMPKNELRPKLELHPWYYAAPNKLFLSESSSFLYKLDPSVQANHARVKQVTDTFFSSPGPGTRCMNAHSIEIQKVQGLRGFDNKLKLECNTFDSKLILNYSLPLSQKNFSELSDCDCSSGFPQCPSDDRAWNLPVKLVKTADLIYDLSGRNVTDWLLKTEFTHEFFKKRFGGFEFVMPNEKLSDANLTRIFSSFTQFLKTVTKLVNIVTSSENESMSPVDYLNDLEFVGVNALYANETVKIWYNTKGYDASVSYLNVLNNAFLRSKTNVFDQNPSDYGNIYVGLGIGISNFGVRNSKFFRQDEV